MANDEKNVNIDEKNAESPQGDGKVKKPRLKKFQQDEEPIKVNLAEPKEEEVKRKKGRSAQTMSKSDLDDFFPEIDRGGVRASLYRRAKYSAMPPYKEFHFFGLEWHATGRSKIVQKVFLSVCLESEEVKKRLGVV